MFDVGMWIILGLVVVYFVGEGVLVGRWDGQMLVHMRYGPLWMANGYISVVIGVVYCLARGRNG